MIPPPKDQMPKKIASVLRKGDCECFHWAYESCSQSFLRILDPTETQINVREAFSPKLFSISERVLDPSEAKFGSQVKNPALYTCVQTRKQNRPNDGAEVGGWPY